MDTFLDYAQLYKKSDIVMWLDISTHCNAKCPQCHRTNPDGLEKVDWLPLVQWSLEDFQKAFPPQTLLSIDGFDFCGTFGDPIMNRDIYEIVEYIISNSAAWIQINTNGSIRSEEWWWSLGVTCANRLEVIFDIDGVTQEQHSHYRQNTNLEKILNNMKTLSFTGAKASVFTVIFKHNRKSLYGIAELCKDYGAKQIVFVPSNRFDEDHSTTYFNTDKEYSLIKSEDIPENFSYKYFLLDQHEHMEIIKNA